MKKTIYICDCCGEMIEEPDWFTVFYGLTSMESNVTKTEKLFEDICSGCMNGLKDVLKTGNLVRKPAQMKEARQPALMKKDSQPVVKKSPKDMPKRQAFDEGKARALRNAGWSLEKIADEMRCSAQTVANHLAKEWQPVEESA